jgi:hypothetical protein
VEALRREHAERAEQAPAVLAEEPRVVLDHQDAAARGDLEIGPSRTRRRRRRTTIAFVRVRSPPDSRLVEFSVSRRTSTNAGRARAQREGVHGRHECERGRRTRRQVGVE